MLWSNGAGAPDQIWDDLGHPGIRRSRIRSESAKGTMERHKIKQNTSVYQWKHLI